MIARMVLCAGVFLLVPAPKDEQKSTEVDPPKRVEKSSETKTPNGDKRAGDGRKPEEGEKSKENDLLPIEANIVRFTNAERARYGLPALEIDQNLMKSARRHCSWMTRNRRLVHTSLPVAENIAMGQRDSRMAVRDWMNSSGHRANILNRGYRRIGVAAYRTLSGTIYWCQQFRR